MNVSTMLDLIKTRYSGMGGTEIETSVAKEFLRSAVVYVESFDYSSNYGYSISNNDISFSAEPSDMVGMLYVLRALLEISSSDTVAKVSNNEIGVNWRSGMDSVSSSGAGKIATNIIESLKDEYSKALKSAKIKSLGMTNISLYG